MGAVSSVCPKCTYPVKPEFFFCPDCGKQLREKPIVVSPWKIFGVFLLSFFLPPIGLYPAIKYIRQTNTNTQIIGWTAVGLTVLAYGIGIYSLMQLMQQFSNVYGTLFR